MKRGLSALNYLIDEARAAAGFPRRPDDGNKKADASTSASKRMNSMFESNVQQSATKTNSVRSHATASIRTTAANNKNPSFDIPLHKSYGSADVKITPEIAQHWLTFNTSNRTVIDQKKIAQFKAHMEEGRWMKNGEAIKFGYGKLLDGQHRLMALVLAGATMHMPVFYGVDPEAQATMDTGRSRTARDVLTIEGVDKWQSGVLGTAIHGIMNVARGSTASNAEKFPNLEVRNFFLEHRTALEASLRAISKLPRKPAILHMSRALQMHYLFAQRDKESADEYFERLYVGDGLTKTSPILHLRQRLMNDLVSKNRRTAFAECAYLIKAWNAYRKGGSWKSGNTLYPLDGQPLPEIQ